MTKEEIKAKADRLADHLGYNRGTLTSIDMREMYCQGYETGKEESKQTAASFAEWANRSGYNLGSEGTKWYKSEWSENGELVKVTSDELFKLYLKSVLI